MELLSIRQLGVGPVVRTPTPRRPYWGRPSWSTAAKLARHKTRSQAPVLHGLASGLQPFMPHLVGWSTPAEAHQTRGNPRFQRIKVKGVRALREPTSMPRLFNLAAHGPMCQFLAGNDDLFGEQALRRLPWIISNPNQEIAADVPGGPLDVTEIRNR